MEKYKYKVYNYKKFLKKKVVLRYVLTEEELNHRRNFFNENIEDIVNDYIKSFRRSFIDGKYNNFAIEAEYTIVTPEKVYNFNETSN